MPITDPPCELVRPSYTIYKYTDQIYKLIHFHSDRMPIRMAGDGETQHYDKKLDAAISRAKRVILELALCNDWEWFGTFTISPDKFDRSDLTTWDKFLKQWLRDKRKEYGGIKLPYLLIPEQHKNGCWHMHGLFASDLSPWLLSFREHRSDFSRLPLYLVNNDFYYWPDYLRRFGFCSFGKIRNKTACAFYVTKYMSKSISDSVLPVGSHLYACSQGLNRSVLHGDVYGDSTYLNQFLTNNYDFVDTGFTKLSDGLDWTFAFDRMELLPLYDPSQEVSEEEVKAFDDYQQWVQDILDDFENSPSGF